MSKWTKAEIDLVFSAYKDSNCYVALDDLAKSVGRNKANVCRKARDLGLTSKSRKRKEFSVKKENKYSCAEDRSAAMSARSKRMIEENGHPRGYLGMKHSDKTKKIISEKSKLAWSSKTEEERMEWVDKMHKASRGSINAGRSRGSWKAAWHEIGGKRNFYRSRWESNYARYLEWLKQNGMISDWKHEPETFWFEEIRRGTRSYKPDFRVWENDGSSCLHEVKGWMDSRSRTCLSRMAKYHPKEKIVLIDGCAYRSIRKKALGLVPGWEDSARDASA